MKSTSSFRGKISSNAAARKTGNNNSYLKLPKGVTLFIPEAGKTYVMDILPYVVTNKKHMDRNDKKEIAIPGEQWFKLPFRVHGNLGEGKNKHKEVCPSTFGKKCGICDYLSSERKRGADEDDLKPMKTSLRNLYAIIVKKINGKTVPDPKIQLFDISDYVFQEKFEEQLQHEEQFETFPDLTEGCSVKIIFVEDSFGGNKYPAPSRFDFVERTKQYGSKFINQVPSLDDCLNILSSEELMAMFQENDVEDDEDEDETPKPKKKAMRGGPASRDDEDEEDDDDDYPESDDDEDDADDEEEDEEDEVPVKKKPSKKPSKPAKKPSKHVEEEDEEDEDADDEEEDDDEEEEEERPKKHSSSKSQKKTASSTSTNKCPSGHKFGKDNNKWDDCDDCELFKKCKAAK